MENKKTFWLIFATVLIFLVLLLIARPKVDPDILTVEEQGGDHIEIPIKELQTLKGIDFQNLTPDTDDAEIIHTVELLERFYEKYSEEKGKTLIKIFYLDQILRYSRLGLLDYWRLTFHSTDGASVMIAPQEFKDNIILISLEKQKGELTLRLIMPEDPFSQRWLKNVARIVVETNN